MDIKGYRKEYLTKVGLNPNHLHDWGIKWRNFKNNAIGRGKICLLSFEHYVDLAVLAGITNPAQIGTEVNQFHMCREGDIGDYVVGNCGFKPHSQNSLEKLLNGGNYRAAQKRSNDFKITSPDGKVYEGRNLNQFCREYDLNRGLMSQVCRGIKAHHKGWKGEYANTI